MKKFLIACMAALMAFSCCSFVACEKPSDTPLDPTSPTEPNTPTNPTTPKDPVVDGSYTYDGIATFAPYTVYNSDGTQEGDTYDSMYLAIRAAGTKSTAKNPMYVLDREGEKIFQRQSQSKCWCYDGTCFVGTMDKLDAIAWAQNHSRSYVLSGQGTAYVYVGSIDYAERNPEDVYELFSGGYSYIFTPNGTMGSGNKWAEYGYAYASATIRLSEATLTESDNSQWNAYIFFNIRGSANCDLGIGSYAGNHGVWKITQNCSADDHKTGVSDTPSFYVYQDQVVTTMTKDENGVYSGADDIFLEAIAGIDTFELKVTNLRTKKTFGYTHYHEGMNEGCEGYFRVIAAVSYCPVEGSVWNAVAGGSLKNVIWEDVKVARYREDGNYEEADKEDLFLGLDTVKYAFTQGADCAHLVFGTHAEAGTYKSGATYEAGSKYISYSSYYDGTHMD